MILKFLQSWLICTESFFESLSLSITFKVIKFYKLKRSTLKVKVIFSFSWKKFDFDLIWKFVKSQVVILNLKFINFQFHFMIFFLSSSIYMYLYLHLINFWNSGLYSINILTLKMIESNNEILFFDETHHEEV